MDLQSSAAAKRQSAIAPKEELFKRHLPDLLFGKTGRDFSLGFEALLEGKSLKTLEFPCAHGGKAILALSKESAAMLDENHVDGGDLGISCITGSLDLLCDSCTIVVKGVKVIFRIKPNETEGPFYPTVTVETVKV